jgi:UDP-N-acetylmuramoyl-L-alanyl-D-glutamate--2,6-diaminopimelate ligase
VLLRELLAGLPEGWVERVDLGGLDIDSGSLAVRAVLDDSKCVGAGDLFVALARDERTRADHLRQAVRAGASVVAGEGGLVGFDAPEHPVVALELAPGRGRRALGLLVATSLGHPSSRLSLVGVTGTNGKTTVCHLVQQVVGSVGRRSRTIGTLTGPMTTPGAVSLQGQLAVALEDGVEVVALEVSSHGLDQDRVAGCRFAVGCFTNLGRDHLDYHGDIDSYFSAKRRLFEVEETAVAVLNRDDDRVRLLAGALSSAGKAVTTFGLEDAEGLTRDGSTWRFAWRGCPVRLDLPGQHNVLNALAAAQICSELGIRDDLIAAGLSQATAPAGRMEPIPNSRGLTVLVDFAHTPDALEVVLTTARQFTGSGGEVWVVLGAGGDRDAGKRPLMGQVAAASADHVVVTSDNPRHESPEAIAEAIVAGTAGSAAEVRMVLDRRQAIATALTESKPGDVVLLAGKGHEVSQDLGSHRIRFDDREVARDLLAGRS